MLFNSLEFLLCFLPLALGVWQLTGGRLRIALLGLTSSVFYAYTGAIWFLLPMFLSGTIDYFAATRIERSEDIAVRRGWLLLSISINLAMLAWFKYAGLFADSIASLAAIVSPKSRLGTSWAATQVTLPPGISFYTFQTLSYTIDVYRRAIRPARSYVDYVAFVTFFPQLVAGPIARYDGLGWEIERAAGEKRAPNWKRGTLLFSVGLCKKVLVADRLANLIDPSIASIGSQPLFVAWCCLLGYAMQIYFDFSGYSDMACGLGELFGLKLPINFNSPYKAVNPQDFWRRWHITLSTFIRDYLYVPLGGNHGSPGRAALTLLLTMCLAGLWHGANWTFVVWGLYHGLLLLGYRATRVRWDSAPLWAQRLGTFLLVCVGWVFFRAPTFVEAGGWLVGLAGGHGLGIEWLSERLALPLLLTIALVMVQRAPGSVEFDFERADRKRVLGIALLTCAALLLMNYSSVFIYYQF